MTEQLKDWVVGGLIISTVAVGIVGFIGTGLNVYGANDNASTEQLEKLEQVTESTSLVTKIQDRTETLDPQPDNVNLPGPIKIIQLSMESVGIWSSFITVSAQVLGISIVDWPITLAVMVVITSIAFLIAGRLL